jgi:hypothetical protein
VGIARRTAHNVERRLSYPRRSAKLAIVKVRFVLPHPPLTRRAILLSLTSPTAPCS